ncbi:DUF664 domain-containing protein [Streptomyces sp. NRRL S-646]|uniref:mycothiol transferase n=1 Tax=Streptomyces sp. NRRL S-646 TaxID=1463917 RepID=UPI00099B7F0F
MRLRPRRPFPSRPGAGPRTPAPQTPEGLNLAVEEYARTNGHADILRERIDGVTRA